MNFRAFIKLKHKLCCVKVVEGRKEILSNKRCLKRVKQLNYDLFAETKT